MSVKIKLDLSVYAQGHLDQGEEIMALDNARSQILAVQKTVPLYGEGWEMLHSMIIQINGRISDIEVGIPLKGYDMPNDL